MCVCVHVHRFVVVGNDLLIFTHQEVNAYEPLGLG